MRNSVFNWRFAFLCMIFVVMLINACATAGTEPPDNRDDGGVPPGEDAAPLCGNRDIDPGEDCEAGKLNGETCESQGMSGGILGCTPACRFDTSNCFGCGDGTRNGDEQCDGTDLAGATCTSEGYLGGVLQCDPVTCTFDITACDTSEVIQNHNNVCDIGLGCSNQDGTDGTPLSVVECFNSASLSPPFWLTEVSYAIGTTRPAPIELNLQVYSWTGAGIPGLLTDTVPLGAADRAVGSHVLALANPIEIISRDFCVGLGSTATNDGFYIQFSKTSTVAGAAWVDAPKCGTNGFGLSTDLGYNGNWCISAVIDKVP